MYISLSHVYTYTVHFPTGGDGHPLFDSGVGASIEVMKKR